MEFYDVINNRRTVREFLDKEVDFEAVNRILEAGTYMIPVFIGIGYPDPNETVLEQNVADLDKQIHYGRWR